ncbi:hypothetical protein P389DRAFT_84135 [Cystobasidium minutum MCA 4210]|uniref:uncharacterized protein n=1 Tax=Cystobasidium minutum MCA 4210 TaxID=1397322 RepID=UPI0034D01D13|eukprot:jgi/Rhomi1/84135/CE84134_9387
MLHTHAQPAKPSVLRSFTAYNALRATPSRAGAPPASSAKDMKDNAKAEVSKVAGDLAKAVSGGNDPHSNAQVSGGSVSEIENTMTSLGQIAQHVPRTAWLAGAAGFIPYVGTSLSTIYLAREASLIASSKTESNIDLDTALALLHHVEQIQISYGAVILSFLGAIHWGFEFSKYGGTKGPVRYMMGIFPVVAGWPTLLLQPQLALAAQWSIFTAVWYLDSRATRMGWAPNWYSTYRFGLTAVVGSLILLTLGASSYFRVASTDNAARKLSDKRTRLGNAREIPASQTEVTAGPRIEGKVGGDIEAEKGEDAFVKFDNAEKRKEKEEEERKKKEEEEKKAAEEKAKEAKDAAMEKAREARDKAEGRA